VGEVDEHALEWNEVFGNADVTKVEGAAAAIEERRTERHRLRGQKSRAKDIREVFA
jgi:hypothetical protein